MSGAAALTRVAAGAKAHGCSGALQQPRACALAGRRTNIALQAGRPEYQSQAKGMLAVGKVLAASASMHARPPDRNGAAWEACLWAAAVSGTGRASAVETRACHVPGEKPLRRASKKLPPTRKSISLTSSRACSLSLWACAQPCALAGSHPFAGCWARVGSRTPGAVHADPGAAPSSSRVCSGSWPTWAGGPNRLGADCSASSRALDQRPDQASTRRAPTSSLSSRAPRASAAVLREPVRCTLGGVHLCSDQRACARALGGPYQ